MGKHLSWSLLLIKSQAFCPATSLRDSNTSAFLWIFGIFKNTYFEVETLENEVYSWFLMSKVINSLLGNVKKVYWNSFTGKGICCSVKH